MVETERESVQITAPRPISLNTHGDVSRAHGFFDVLSDLLRFDLQRGRFWLVVVLSILIAAFIALFLFQLTALSVSGYVMSELRNFFFNLTDMDLWLRNLDHLLALDFESLSGEFIDMAELVGLGFAAASVIAVGLYTGLLVTLVLDIALTLAVAVSMLFLNNYFMAGLLRDRRHVNDGHRESIWRIAVIYLKWRIYYYLSLLLLSPILIFVWLIPVVGTVATVVLYAWFHGQAYLELASRYHVQVNAAEALRKRKRMTVGGLFILLHVVLFLVIYAAGAMLVIPIEPVSITVGLSLAVFFHWFQLAYASALADRLIDSTPSAALG